MDEKGLSRAKILAAFGVTEEEIAAIDNGYSEAVRGARQQEEAFLEYLAATAKRFEVELTD